MILGLLIWACDAAPEDSTPAADSAAVSTELLPLEAPRLLRRLSLDLRGVLPSIEEQEAVEADPEQLTQLLEQMLEDPRLEDQIVEWLTERWHTRIDAFPAEIIDFSLSEEEEFTFERSVGEEPLRLAARTVMEDLPWSEILLSDTTLADDMLLEIFPLEAAEEGEGWRRARYTDGRPPAGVLATNGLWWRYVTNNSNANRARAAAISRLFLCEDLLARPVSFDGLPSLSETEGAGDAIREEETCLSCHATIEPIAASLFGFWWAADYSAIEMTTYHGERETLAEDFLGVSPGWFGQPVEGLAGLARAAAQDPRFWSCGARTFLEALWRRPLETEDSATLEHYHRVFLQEGGEVKGLIRRITEDPSYRVAEVAGEDDGSSLTVRMVPAGTLASAVEELTGFRWTWSGYDQLANDHLGYRVQAGGVDGYYVTQPQQDPSLTWALVTRNLLEAAGDWAVQQALAGAPPPLLEGIELDWESSPDASSLESALAELMWRLYAERPSEQMIADAASLWQALAQLTAPREAWSASLSALMRDPLFVSY